MSQAIQQIMCKIPIGTKLKLKDDYPDVIHDVVGYEVYNSDAYILFKDGTKLHIARIDELVEFL